MCDSNNCLDYYQGNYLGSERSGLSRILTENSDWQVKWLISWASGRRGQTVSDRLTVVSVCHLVNC